MKVFSSTVIGAKYYTGKKKYLSDFPSCRSLRNDVLSMSDSLEPIYPLMSLSLESYENIKNSSLFLDFCDNIVMIMI